MSSGNAYERVFKLWISLWNLVLEDKRQLETVTTTLQRIVFEERGYPHFKNWPEICKLGETDHMLMMAVATIVSYSDDENVQNLIAAFPKCFSYDEVIGPHPLSLILDEAQKNGAEQGSNNGRDYPFSHDAIPEWIPLQGLDIYGNNVASLTVPSFPRTSTRMPNRARSSSGKARSSWLSRTTTAAKRCGWSRPSASGPTCSTTSETRDTPPGKLGGVFQFLGTIGQQGSQNVPSPLRFLKLNFGRDFCICEF